MAKLKESEALANAAAGTAAKLNIINQAVETETKAREEKQNDEKEKMLVNFYMSKAKKKEYEKLFGSEGISLSHGIRMCLDYAVLQIMAEKLIISESGIHENILNNLK